MSFKCFKPNTLSNTFDDRISAVHIYWKLSWQIILLYEKINNQPWPTRVLIDYWKFDKHCTTLDKLQILHINGEPEGRALICCICNFSRLVLCISLHSWMPTVVCSNIVQHFIIFRACHIIKFIRDKNIVLKKGKVGFSFISIFWGIQLWYLFYVSMLVMNSILSMMTSHTAIILNGRKLEDPLSMLH